MQESVQNNSGASISLLLSQLLDLILLRFRKDFGLNKLYLQLFRSSFFDFDLGLN